MCQLILTITVKDGMQISAQCGRCAKNITVSNPDMPVSWALQHKVPQSSTDAASVTHFVKHVPAASDALLDRLDRMLRYIALHVNVA